MEDKKKYRHDLLKAARLAQGKTFMDMARLTNLSRQTLTDAENGKNVKVDTLLAIAEQLGIDPKILFDFSIEFDAAALFKNAIEQSGNQQAA